MDTNETSTENNYQVLMSPLLSNRLNNLEDKLDKVLNQLNVITNYNHNIENILQENKKIYISLMKQNQELSQKNMDILTNNRQAYVEALEKLDENETEVKAILEKLEKDNKDLSENIGNTTSECRIYNRYWRSSGINTIMKPLSSDLISKLNNKN
jgi:chromosome segregation ATPase